MATATASVQYGTVDRRAGLSAQEFKREYLNRRPVIVTDAMKDWKACTAWQFESLKARYGNSQHHLLHLVEKPLPL